MPLEEQQVPALGQRIIIVGGSCAGKSTLGVRLAAALTAPFVELDALAWRPNWQPAPDEEFTRQILAATAGDRWVVAGNYNKHTMSTAWPRADTVIWLDFPLALVLWRIVRRSWVRSRSKELLWGTNTERFWRQFRLWSDESLIRYTVRTHRGRRKFYLDAMQTDAWTHICFVRVRERRKADRIVTEAERAAGGRQPNAPESPGAAP
jgi:adenylate kinase family enzyme